MPRTSSRSSSPLVHEPEEWPRVFENHLNSGDLEGAVSLYEPDASFVPASGETVLGRDGVRSALAAFIEAKAQFQAPVRKVIAVGDVALLYTDWVVRTVDPSGEADEAPHRAIEVLRRQPTEPGSSSWATRMDGDELEAIPRAGGVESRAPRWPSQRGAETRPVTGGQHEELARYGQAAVAG